MWKLSCAWSKVIRCVSYDAVDAYLADMINFTNHQSLGLSCDMMIQRRSNK